MQLFEIVAIVAIVLALASGIGLGLVYRRLQHYQRNQHVIMGSRGTVDIVEHVAALDDKLANIRLAVEDLTLAARDHDVRIDNSLARVGIVRFDAYRDLGGRQSASIAFLNSLGDGVVITTAVSRDFARMYVKLLKGGEPDIPLAPEEIEAVEQARGSTPFTIRPRVEDASADDTDKSPKTETGPASVDAPFSNGLPGLRSDADRRLERENRKRRRRGLPTVEEEVPSTRGWDQPRTPSAVSMAQEFVQERRQSLDQRKDENNHKDGSDWLSTFQNPNGDDREM